MIDATLLGRQLERERKARKSAEILLEMKSLELYEANRALLQLNTKLEQLVEERTCKLQQLNGELRSEINLRKATERNLRTYEQRLKRLAFYDPLTQLPNRSLFNDRLGVALVNAERQDYLAAVIYLDVDRFKYVNDTLGHAAGDQLLVEVSRRISHCTRTADTVARLGGDEFTVLLTHLKNREEALVIIERLIETIGCPVKLGEVMVYVSASVGISFYPEDSRDAEALRMYADLALYEAKERGRGQYCRFSPEMLAKSNERLSLSAELDSALKNDEFSLVYQPIMNVSSGAADSMEALIRWQRPDGQNVPPATFIPHAEMAGLIFKVDCWVLEHACRDAVDWSRNGRERLGVAVNLSAVSVQQPHMPKIVAKILRRTRLPPELLTLEITETAVIADPGAARKVLEDIVALGVGLSVDDFGTGYSSLSYLTQFPIDCIKLDRVFINRIGKDKTSEAVIQSVLDLANKLGLRVIAEGVEEAEQQAYLAMVGCELMQGFHLIEPLPATRIRDWLRGRRLAAEVMQPGKQMELNKSGFSSARARSS